MTKYKNVFQAVVGYFNTNLVGQICSRKEMFDYINFTYDKKYSEQTVDKYRRMLEDTGFLQKIYQINNQPIAGKFILCSMIPTNMSLHVLNIMYYQSMKFPIENWKACGLVNINKEFEYWYHNLDSDWDRQYKTEQKKRRALHQNNYPIFEC